MIDSHCHLGLIDEQGDLKTALEAARAAGITHLVDVGLDPESTRAALERADALEGPGPVVGVGVGWHPHLGRMPTPDELAELRRLASQRRAVAIGEIGLDHHFSEHFSTPPDLQVEILAALLDLARECDLPVIIHSRDVGPAILPVLRRHPGVRGVMHCFIGSPAEALALVELGFHISFAGPVTYPRAEELREAAAAVPLDRLLVETDSPFLPPQSMRGRRNHPAMLGEVATRVAEVRGLPVAELVDATTANALALFGRLAVL